MSIGYRIILCIFCPMMIVIVLYTIRLFWDEIRHFLLYKQVNRMVRQYWKIFGKKCECGANLYGSEFCMDFNHDENIIINKRENKIKQIL